MCICIGRHCHMDHHLELQHRRNRRTRQHWVQKGHLPHWKSTSLVKSYRRCMPRQNARNTTEKRLLSPTFCQDWLSLQKARLSQSHLPNWISWSVIRCTSGVNSDVRFNFRYDVISFSKQQTLEFKWSIASLLFSFSWNQYEFKTFWFKTLTRWAFKYWS